MTIVFTHDQLDAVHQILCDRLAHEVNDRAAYRAAGDDAYAEHIDGLVRLLDDTLLELTVVLSEPGWALAELNTLGR